MRVVLATLLATAAAAQPSNWAPPAAGSSVSLAVERPLFETADGLASYSSAWTLGGAREVALGVRVVGEVPFAFGGIAFGDDAFGVDERGAALGNVLVGVEAELPISPGMVGGYLRAPTATATDDGGTAQAVGLTSDYDRFGAYVEDVVTVAVLAEARPALRGAPVAFRLRAVPQVLVPTDDTFGARAEVFVGYAAQALVGVGPARVLAGVSGLSLLTEDGEDRHNVFVGATVEAAAGPARVGLTGRVPVAGRVEDFLDGVVGLRLTLGR